MCRLDIKRKYVYDKLEMNFECGLLKSELNSFPNWMKTTHGCREKPCKEADQAPVELNNNPEVSIHDAARSGNKDAIRYFLSSGVSPDELDGEGCTPLMVATIGRNTDVIQLLIHFGANVNYCSSELGTALHIACFNGCLAIVNCLMEASLLRSEMQLDSGNGLGLTALHAAVIGNWTYTTLYMIQHGANVNKQDCKGNLPLQYAVKEMNGSIIKALIKAGCHRNHMNTSFESPLHIAIRIGHLPTIGLLMKLGCNVNVSKPDGNGPLHTLVSKYCSRYPANFRLVLEILLSGGCDINKQAFGTLETPLYRAIHFQKQDVAAILLAYGANPNLSSPFDITALQLATRNQDLQTVLLMVHCGIDWKRERWIGQQSFFESQESQTCSKLLYQWKNETISLQNLCRIATRKYHKNSLFKDLNGMNHLPVSVKNFIMLNDLLKKQYCGEVTSSSWLLENADETYGPAFRRKNDKEDITAMEYDQSQ